jgi:hypothetical protein
MSIEAGDTKDLSLGERIAIIDHEKVKTAADKKAGRLENAVNIVDAVLDSPHYEEILRTLSADARRPITEIDVLEARSELRGVVEFELRIGQLGLDAANSIRENGLPR